MRPLKIFVTFAFTVGGLAACVSTTQQRFVIADSKAYEASLFRQNCAVCHGPEGDGKVLDDGKQVPSLRVGEFKTHNESEIYRQIADGGNGMTPFRNQLSDNELKLMTSFVIHQLREQ